MDFSSGTASVSEEMAGALVTTHKRPHLGDIMRKIWSETYDNAGHDIRLYEKTTLDRYND